MATSLRFVEIEAYFKVKRGNEVKPVLEPAVFLFNPKMIVYIEDDIINDKPYTHVRVADGSEFWIEDTKEENRNYLANL